MRFVTLATAVAAAGLSVSAASAATVSYTNRTAWNAAVQGHTVMTEDFNGFTAGANPETASWSASSAIVGWESGWSQVKFFNVGGNIVVQDQVSHNAPVNVSGSVPNQFTTIHLNGQFNAFGADFSLSQPGGGEPARGPGVGIALYRGETLVTAIPSTTFQGFFGFTSDVLFDRIVLRNATSPGDANNGVDTFSIDNVAAAVVIPLPSAGAMGLAGLALVAGRRRR